MRLIDADALAQSHIDCPPYLSFFEFGEMVEMFLKLIDAQPTIIDAKTCEIVGYRQVVTCRECEHRITNPKWRPGSKRLKAYCDLDTGDPFELGRNAWDDEWFCADGERKKIEKS